MGLLTAAALLMLYMLDRWLVLPLAVRALLLVVVAALGVREIARRIVRPMFRGADRQDLSIRWTEVSSCAQYRVETALEANGVFQVLSDVTRDESALFFGGGDEENATVRFYRLVTNL